MQWHELYPKTIEPTMENIRDYIGGEAAALWTSLLDECGKRWKTRIKPSYSVCSGKPGWNIKLQKSGVTFGTLYPEPGSFSVFVVIPSSADAAMREILSHLSPDLAQMYLQAGDYMKVGKWMMFRVLDRAGVEDYLRIVELKARK